MNMAFYDRVSGALANPEKLLGDPSMVLFDAGKSDCELEGVNAFNYLVQLQRHTDHVEDNPQLWMPWNYIETLASLQPDST